MTRLYLLLILLGSIIQLVASASAPDCRMWTRFPTEGNNICLVAGVSLKKARDYQKLGDSAKFWLNALWTFECNTAADVETCLACNTADVNRAWMSTTSTMTDAQLCANAAAIIGAPNCNGCI